MFCFSLWNNKFNETLLGETFTSFVSINRYNFTIDGWLIVRINWTSFNTLDFYYQHYYINNKKQEITYLCIVSITQKKNEKKRIYTCVCDNSNLRTALTATTLFDSLSIALYTLENAPLKKRWKWNGWHVFMMVYCYFSWFHYANPE